MTKARIAIVDDEEELRANLKDLLEFEGYAVYAYSNGEDALAELPAVQPHLILLDVQLPGIDGIEVLRRLHLDHPDWPVVIVSASSEPGVLDKAQEYGAREIILKPFNQDEILAHISRYTQS